MKKGFLWKRIVFAFIIINICYIAVNQQIKMHKIESDIDNTTAQTQKLEKENRQLQDEMKMSQSDKYNEKLIREKLGLVKNGEVPVINSSNNK